MKIKDEIRKCVGFIGYKTVGSDYRMAGSVFFLGRQDNGRAISSYAVTARHVIDGINSLGGTETHLRLNFKNGESGWFRIPINSWFTHPIDSSIDVAITPVGLTSELDHLVFPYSLCISEEKMEENEIGHGDEVFIVGLFRHHHGSKKNIPIIRVGNIAALSEEHISTQAFGEIDAYLIEARSIGGLSGSPVFLNLGTTRIIKGQLKFASQEPIFYLFGLIHGHFDVKSKAVDEADDKNDLLTPDRVNTGIAIVVPFHNIDEVIIEFEKRANESIQPTAGSGG